MYILAFVIALLASFLLTPYVKKLAFAIGAVDKPDKRKVHTHIMPRLGGLAIFLACVLAVVCSLPITRDLMGILLGGAWIVIVGILDDKYSLPAKVKLLGQILAACILVAFDIKIEWLNNPLGGYFYLEYLSIPFTIFWVISFINVVNLIDGLDGLASGTSMPVCLFFVAVTFAWGERFLELGLFASGLAGGLLGFLVYNFYPAKVFMGDTGSLFLGGAIAAMAFAYDMPLILVTLGVVYIIETLSDIIQVGYFKLTHGKRVFRMAPFHHHLEMGGWTGKKWKEVEIFALFSGISLLFAIISFIGVFHRAF